MAKRNLATWRTTATAQKERGTRRSQDKSTRIKLRKTATRQNGKQARTTVVCRIRGERRLREWRNRTLQVQEQEDRRARNHRGRSETERIATLRRVVSERCTKRNFMFKAECRRCQAPPNKAQRNEGAGGKGRADTPPWTQRTGKIVVVEGEAAALHTVQRESARRYSSEGDDQQRRKTKSPYDSEADKISIARQTKTPRTPGHSAKNTHGGRRREHGKGTVGTNRGLAHASAERAERRPKQSMQKWRQQKKAPESPSKS